MSINVTVHGNPVSIKRGKMVALDPSKELEVRRKIRIQQVRQQSKRIAEEVRNKVKKEKSKQLNKLGNEAQNDYKEKQNKKLTCLQQHYKSCMTDFGCAFKDASNEPDPNELIENLTKENRQQAEIRGKTAEQKLQYTNENKQKEENKHVENLKYARYVEDVRSKLVSDLPNNKHKRKRCIADIQINGKVHNVEESESSNESDLYNLSVLDEADESFTSENCDNECTSQNNSNQFDSGSLTQSNEKLIDNDNDEYRCKGGKDVHVELPVCGYQNRDITSYGERLEAIADSLKKIAVEYKEPCNGQPCAAVLESVLNAGTATISKNIEQSSCVCEPKTSPCSICSIQSKNSEKPRTKSAEIQSKRNVNSQTTNSVEFQQITGPIRPVITSEPNSPKKRSHSKKHQMINSPEKPFPFRKTIISEKTPCNHDVELQTECIKIVSPIKMLPKKSMRQKQPMKKLCKKKSSIHDCNYFLPTVPANVIKKRLPDDAYSLPTVPTTIIKSDADIETKECSVQCYDHFNKFEKQAYQPALIQKISKDSIDIIPDDDSDIQKENGLCKKREQDAKLRANKAHEKIKIHQDYQKLLQELPILQKQERLANMPAHKPSLHMSKERYQIYERQKQNTMENKFENMQSKAKQFGLPTVTLKSVKKFPPSSNTKVPLKKLDVSDEGAVLNVGQWEKVNTSASDQNYSNTEDCLDNKCSEETIADLLKRINKQRELLLKEAVNLKSLKSLKGILNDEELINIICNCPQRQKVFVETATSPLNKNTLTPPRSRKKSSTSTSIPTKRSPVSSSDTSFETHKTKSSKIKPKVKKLKVYLREEATQTSPAVSSNASKCEKKEGFTQTSVAFTSSSSQKSKTRSRKSQRSKSSTRRTSPVSVPVSMVKQSSSDDKVCEIIIRTAEQNVKINPVSNNVKFDSQLSTNEFQNKNVVIKIKEPKPINNLEMSSSTAYMSPPNAIKSKEKTCATISSVIEPSRPSNKHLLQPKKQQTNLDSLVKIENGAKQINPRLVKYIMRLLNMSRQGIDELTISSVSDVSTPQASIIQSANNVAMGKLQTVMEHFNLSPNDIKKLYLSSSTLSDETIERVEEISAQSVLPEESTSTSTEGVQIGLKDKRSTAQKKPEEKNIYTSSSSKSKTLQSTRITNWQMTAGSYPGKQIESETKDSIKRSSTSPENHFQSSSPKSTTQPSTTITQKNTYIKIALPKTETTTDPSYSTEKTILPSSTQQINIGKDNPEILVSKKQDITPITDKSDTTSSEEALLKNPEKFLHFVRESLGMTMEEFSELGFEQMFSRHMELTEYCHDRIKSLMSLIEQIRNEKKEIYSSPIDNSVTSYLELPPPKLKKTDIKPSTIDQVDQDYGNIVQSCLDNEISSSSSISQEAIDRYLLGIESDTELNGKKKEKEAKQKKKSPDKNRLQSGESPKQPQQTFVPILQGIPKYSEANVIDPNILENLLQQIKPKPPPALLRSNMRGHTNEIPHELSTIIEADTLLSSRNASMQRARSPEERIPSKEVSPRAISKSPKKDKNSLKKKEEKQSIEESNTPRNSSAGYVTISPERTLSSGDKKSGNSKRINASQTLHSSPENDTRTKSGLSGIQSMSGSSQETPDELEELLRKLKLEWAISLVKKTEQALALSTSSSSSDIRGKKDVSSDVSVKESFRHLCKRLASLNESDIERAQIVSDLSHHFREFHDISEIPGVADNKNKSNQRTSTPVQHSKSTESKKSITNESFFKVDSELSSVKNSSDENNDQLFLSIPNVTLNTEHISLNKT